MVFNARTDLAELRALRGGLDSNAAPFYDPAHVLDSALRIVKSNSGLIDEVEKWALYEQIVVAAYDTGDVTTGNSYLDQILAKFPPKDSSRSSRLLGLQFESTGQFDKAVEVYEAALAKDESNIGLHKRIITALRAQGRKQEAIEGLVRYLDVFMSDIEGWLELSSLYLGELMYQQAAFCLEEVILLRPSNHLYHLRYADILFSFGQVELALKHYCRALELCTDNVRAFYGIRTSILALASKNDKGRGTQVDVETRDSLKKLAEEQLSSLYAKAGKDAATINTILKAWIQERA
ncbi:hypothetical protein BJ742DRAFT_823148 [Cladochytrium replicatum]|nr:hypothetical protein BJ742DRAFT_823148 [Cladochytrium replicatum]